MRSRDVILSITGFLVSETTRNDVLHLPSTAEIDLFVIFFFQSSQDRLHQGYFDFKPKTLFISFAFKERKREF